MQRKTCSMATKMRTQFLDDTSGANDCRSLSMANKAQLVITENTDARLKARNQAPMSRTPLGVGFLHKWNERKS